MPRVVRALPILTLSLSLLAIGCSQDEPAPSVVMTESVRPTLSGVPGYANITGTFGASDKGCLTFSPVEGEEVLVIAPYGSRLVDDDRALELETGKVLELDGPLTLYGSAFDHYRGSQETRPRDWDLCVPSTADTAPVFHFYLP